VGNRGETTARACAAQLTIFPFEPVRPFNLGIEDEAEVAADAIQLYLDLRSVTRFWNQSNHPIEINIHPYQSQRIEICRALLRRPSFAGIPEIRIPGESPSDLPRAMFSSPGFEFCLEVGSESARPATAFGRFDVSTTKSKLELTTKLKYLAPLVTERASWWRRHFSRTARP